MDFSLPLDPIVEAAADLVFKRLSALHTPQTFMTVPEAAEYLRCKPKRLYNLCDEGRLSRVKEGTRLLLLRSEVESLLEVEPARLRS